MKKLCILIVTILFISLGFAKPNSLSASATMGSYSPECLNEANLAVSARFKGGEAFSSELNQKIDATFNHSRASVKDYFDKVSLGKLEINTSYTGGDGIELSKDENYFKPKYKTNAKGEYIIDNELGYDNRYFREDGTEAPSSESGVKQHIDRLLREQIMVREIISSVKVGELSLGELDKDGNGAVDILTLIIKTDFNKGGFWGHFSGGSSSWSDLLWPHMSFIIKADDKGLENSYYIPDGYLDEHKDELYTPTVNGLKIDEFIILTTSYLEEKTISDGEVKLLNVGAVCHETMHAVGLNDYYSYENATYPSVGEFDIMGDTTFLPQMPLSFNRVKMGWLEEGVNVLPIEYSGDYVLSPVTSDSAVKAYKLVLNDYAQTGEYFMLEVRSNKGLYDQLLTGSGLIIYRVNEGNGYLGPNGVKTRVNYGNMYGDDEVYVYRYGNAVMNTIKLNLTADKSLALLDGTTIKNAPNTDGYDYDKSTFGIREKFAYKPIKDGNYIKTPITYTNGLNSGIVISNVSMDEEGKVSFHIEFDCEDAGVEFSAKAGSYYDLVQKYVSWTAPSRSGKVTVYGFDAKATAKYKNGAYFATKTPTVEELESGKFKKALFSVTRPASFSGSVLPKTDGAVSVFLVYEDASGNKQVVFGGVAGAEKPTFFDFILGSPIWLSLICFFVVILVGAIVFGVIVIIKKSKAERAAAEKESDDLEDGLIEELGENYWEVEETEEEETVKAEE